MYNLRLSGHVEARQPVDDGCHNLVGAATAYHLEDTKPNKSDQPLRRGVCRTGARSVNVEGVRCEQDGSR